MWCGLFMASRELGTILSNRIGDNNYGYSGPAGIRTLVDADKLVAQVLQGENDVALAKAINSFVLGDIFGLPSTAFNRLAETAYAVNDGEDVNALMSVLFGYKKK